MKGLLRWLLKAIINKELLKAYNEGYSYGLRQGYSNGFQSGKAYTGKSGVILGLRKEIENILDMKGFY